MSVNTKMTAIADGIRELSGATGKLSLDGMATNIETANSEVGEQSNLLEQALALLDGKAMGAGGITPEGTITITENGTYNVTNYALANVALPEAEQATPTISVSSSGLITASTTQESGVVKAGTKSNTKQLTVQAAKTVTPSTSAQTAVASGRYTTGAVTVAGDTDLVAGNIKKGVSIFNVTGTYEGDGGIDTSDATATANDIAFGKTAYVNDEKITGEIYELLDGDKAEAEIDSNLISVDSANGDIVIDLNFTTSSGSGGLLLRHGSKIISKINMSLLGDAEASNVLSGKTFTSSDGLKVEGTMKNNGAVAGTISTKSGSYTVPVGYHNGSGKVSISSTEQAKIIADNIKSGISILGVTGTYTGSGLPNNISAIENGEFTLSYDNASSYTVTHNLGVEPDLFLMYAEDFNTLSGTSYYLLLQYFVRFSPFDTSNGNTHSVSTNTSYESGYSKYSNIVEISEYNSATCKIAISTTGKLKAGVKYKWLAMKYV